MLPSDIQTVKPGAIDGLVAALSSDDVMLQHDVVRALAVFARDGDVRAHVCTLLIILAHCLHTVYFICDE
jgi:hypothetical protein